MDSLFIPFFCYVFRQITSLTQKELLKTFGTKKERQLYLSYRSFVLNVIPGGEMSNFLFDDYEAILKFMNAEKQKKTLKM